MYYLIPNIRYILCIKYYIIYAFLTSPPAAALCSLLGLLLGPLGPVELLGVMLGLLLGPLGPVELLGVMLGPVEPLGALPCRLNTRQYKGKKTH